uniref:RlpA-like protein double-psi beta-barrel domain-containing protein n=1 Tax=Bionectria ochroleuca TaxID=29856 RepID=A0A8H7K867_BIOOC
MSFFKSLLLATVAATSAVAYTGDMTYFNQGLGSCGQVKTDSDAVVALSAADYGEWANPNQATVCGKWIKITANGKTVRAQVWDKCPGGECVSGGIDVSPSVFTQIADLSVGRLTVSWEFEEGSGGGSPDPTTAVPAPTSEAPAPTSEAPVPTTTSEVIVPTTTSEVVVPSSTSEVVVPSSSSSSTTIAAPTTFSTRVRPSTTSQAAPSTTSLPGQVLVETNRVKVVVVTQWVTATVTEGAVPTSSS